MTTFTYTNQLTVVECAQCHMDFAMPVDFERDRRRDHRTFYCPSGHSSFFPGKSDVEKERERADLAERQATTRLAALDRERAAHAHTERRLRSTKAVVTRVKNRIAAGACPCCHERFPDLAEHMAAQHPGYGDEGGTA